MTAGSISVENATVFYSYRGKGGKTGKRELLRPAFEATCIWLECLGKDLTMMRPDESLWPAMRGGRGITSGTFYTNLRCYLKNAGLPSGGVHIFRTRRRSCIAMTGSRSKTCRVPRPLQPGCDDDLPHASRGAGGPELGEGGRGAIGV